MARWCGKPWGLAFTLGWLVLLFLLPQPAHAQWTLVWSDEFNGPAGSAPNPANWTYDLGNDFGNGEIDWATDTRANSFLDGQGNLVVAALFDPGAVHPYTSAHLKTAGRVAVGPYGRVEARI